ncbi:Protein kinase [uncultured virus]|nr:Protein kinase [uncultured virus]
MESKLDQDPVTESERLCARLVKLRQEVRVLIEGKYEYIVYLTKTLYGELYLVKHKETKVQYCAKVSRLSVWKAKAETLPGGLCDNPEAEAKLLMELKGTPQVVQGVEVLHGEDLICLIMEYIDGPNLGNYPYQIKPPSTEAELKVVYRQLLRGVQHLNDKGHVLIDLAMNNVMYAKAGSPEAPDDWQVKLIDFGRTYPIDDIKVAEADMKYAASKEAWPMRDDYMAPEVLLCHVKGTPWDPVTVQTWIVGTVLYFIATGAFPYEEPGDLLHRELYRGTWTERDTVKHLSSEWKQFVGSTFQMPADRASLKALLASDYLAEVLPLST